MVNNQLGRRNLTTEQASYLRGKRYMEERKEQGAPVGNNHAEKNKGAKVTPLIFPRDMGKTADKLAAEYKVSRAAWPPPKRLA